jgi:hypothetical protein
LALFSLHFLIINFNSGRQGENGGVDNTEDSQTFSVTCVFLMVLETKKTPNTDTTSTYILALLKDNLFIQFTPLYMYYRLDSVSLAFLV